MSSQVFFQRADVRKCSSKYVLLKISKYLQESTSALRPATLLKRDSNTGMLCEYCEIFKKTFLCRTPTVAAPFFKELIKP